MEKECLIDVDDYIVYREEITNKVKDILINYLNLPLEREEISEDSLLFGLGLGLDSVDTLEITIGIEKEFDITISEDDMVIFRSINSLVDFIVEKTGYKLV
jgi:acyl carrier protein